jgi:hypothetical protein
LHNFQFQMDEKSPVCSIFQSEIKEGRLVDLSCIKLTCPVSCIMINGYKINK